MNRLIWLVFVGLLATPSASSAQSDSSSPSDPILEGTGNSISRESTIRPEGQPMMSGRVAMDGYCPVSLATNRKWVAGSGQHQAFFDGQIYRFPSADALATFQANPLKFVSVLGGDDIVTYARTGRRVPGKLAIGVTHLGRHYFFSTDANKEAFSADPMSYVSVDVAMGGACAVCRIDQNANMPGKPDVVAMHNGLRYFFLSSQQKQSFLAEPSRYTAPPRRAVDMGASGR